MISDPALLLSAFMLGFLGSGHCLGMCGGLSAALGLNTLSPTSIASSGNTSRASSTPPTGKLLGYHLGRLLSYSIAGLIVGSLGFWLTQQLAALTVLRYLAAIMLILMGLHIGQWFSGILVTEKIGLRLWQLVQPLSKRFMPVKSVKDAILVGMVWGWLPCGLVYSALIWAGTEASLIGSPLIMLAFGCGTLPSMLATGAFAHQTKMLLQHRLIRPVSGALMVLFGVYTMPITQQLILT